MKAAAAFATVLLCCAGAATAQTAPACRVIDAELQASYRGGCVEGLAEGRGEARGTALYTGDFKAGRKHGKGVKTWPATGDRYEGDFVEDRKHGTGVYVWGRGSPSAGERYTGGYVADRRHGQGVYDWPNGDRYTGPWEEDRPTGPPTKGMIARSRALAERAAVVGIPGAKVCRELRVGLAIEDVVRGTVIAREGELIRVRIEDAGRFEHVIGDRAVRKGEVVADRLRLWLPCV